MNQVGGKSALRKRLRERRNALEGGVQARAAVDLVARLQALPAFRRSGRIALYVANDGEIDPAGVVAWCLEHGKRCYAPVIVGGESDRNRNQNRLRFAEITARTVFQNNRFGIAEPAVAAAQLIDARELDLVLLPLVGFDGCGNRIGMGGGFYDATFAFKKSSPRSLPKLVGLAFEIQRVENIAADNWDIPISSVVTERRIYQCTDGTDDEAQCGGGQ